MVADVEKKPLQEGSCRKALLSTTLRELLKAYRRLGSSWHPYFFALLSFALLFFLVFLLVPLVFSLSLYYAFLSVLSEQTAKQNF